MTKIKITSNPYIREITYSHYNDIQNSWEDISVSNTNSTLRNDKTGKSFLPFKIKEIVDTIIEEYYVGSEPVEIVFEGTQDEYAELQAVCQSETVKDKIHTSRSNVMLENARLIFRPTKDTFTKVQPIIEKIINDDNAVIKKLNKVSDALKDIIPICVFGNYSAGKSTFINALIGSEVLPSGGDPVTAKIYKIERSQNDDVARIKYTCKNEEYEFLFEGTTLRIVRGSNDNDLINEIKEELASLPDLDMATSVNKALDLINGYEKKDKNSTDISNVINVEFPFSPKGILGKSHNNFVIFDTPGSNSSSNTEHSKVLAEALDGFSNGIPVWVSTYESLDSTDNASLCEKILDIQALDKRFTMIVLNKADGSDLDEDGFTKIKEQEILEYDSVEKMYASGIYFVSSIMGLGCKNDGELKDKFYRKTFRKQEDMFVDTEDEDYTTLYKYNIMPEQIKRNAMEYSQNVSEAERIYANSGLYCIEHEMENFGTKYSAYNKCQMVYSFLSEVIEETNKRIEARTESLKRTREARQRELDAKKAELIVQINHTSHDKEYEYEKLSRKYSREVAANNTEYLYNIEAMENLAEKLRSKNADEKDFSRHEQEVKDSTNSMFSHLKENGEQIFGQDIKKITKDNLFDSVKNLASDVKRDLTEVVETRIAMKDTDTEIDKQTSDELLEIVKGEYKLNISRAQEILTATIKEHWSKNANDIREILVQIVTGSDALQSSQREELKDIIMNYQPLDFVDDSDNVFIKERFLSGTFFGFIIRNSEKLNIPLLTRVYNNKVTDTMISMATEMNTSCFLSFKKWKEGLSITIEENITDYNPQLRDMSDMIREETEKIEEYENDKNQIRKALNEIKYRMSWLYLEQE